MGEQAVVYCRVSTKEQGKDDKPSLGQQEEKCRQYIGLYEMYVGKVYTDVTSGGKWDRPGLQQLLADAAGGEIKRVVFLAIDRLGRNLKDLLEIEEKLSTHGIGLASIKQQFDTSTPTGKLIFHVLGAVAEMEAAQIAERTSAGRQGSAEIGHWPGSQVPYGYARVNKVLRVQLSEARVLRRMVRLVLDEDMGAAAIAKNFTRRGLTPPNDATKWWPSSVNHFLTKPYYSKGEIEYSGEAVPCPILIRPDERRKINAVFLERKQRSPRSTTSFHLLQHLMFCRQCDSMYHSNTQRGVKVYYCGARRQKRTYENGNGVQPVHDLAATAQWSWKASILEAKVKAKVLAFIASPAETIKRNKAYIERNKAVDGDDKEKADLRNDLALLEEERDRVLSQNQKGYVTEHDLDKAMGAIGKKREKIDARLGELDDVGGTVDPDEIEWLAALEAESTLYGKLLAKITTAGGKNRQGLHSLGDILKADNSDPQDWRTLIETIVERVYVENNGTVSVVFAGSDS